MINRIKKFFEDLTAQQLSSSGADIVDNIPLATAALLVEMTRVDEEIKQEEINAVRQIIQTRFGLSSSESDELMRLADHSVTQATCYHEFTSLINKQLEYSKKIQIIELLWQIAYADEELQKHEDHLVRKIANLIHVSHRDFIAAKHRIQEQRTSS